MTGGAHLLLVELGGLLTAALLVGLAAVWSAVLAVYRLVDLDPNRPPGPLLTTPVRAAGSSRRRDGRYRAGQPARPSSGGAGGLRRGTNTSAGDRQHAVPLRLRPMVDSREVFLSVEPLPRA